LAAEERAAMTTRQLKIERVYTADAVRIEYDANGVEIGWACTPMEPDHTSLWVIFDFSPDSKTGWRRITLRWEPVE
jgi:hypothetical protein